MQETIDYRKYTWLAGSLALVCIAFASVAMGLHDLDAVKHPNGQVASITVTGEGEVTAIPDIGTVTFTVRESAKAGPEAQKAAEAKIAKVLEKITALGVDKKDIKTASYTLNPKYETQGGGYCQGFVCPPVKTVITGYEAVQSVTVKIRNLEKIGDVVGAIGAVNITEISGPEFAVDDTDKLDAEAKAEAIKKAQAKAEATAEALGVSLGAITQFSEDNGGAYPVMYSVRAMSAKAEVASDAVTLPEGESVIKSRVTITYSLK